VNTVKPGKQGFVKRLRALARDKEITHGAFRALVVLMMFADNQGRAWPSLTTLAKASGISSKGLTKILPVLERAGFLRIVRIGTGDELPNGNRSSRQRSVYMLSEAVCGVPGSLECVQLPTEPGSPKQESLTSEHSSAERAGFTSEPGSTKQIPHSPERSSLSLVNQVPVIGELSSLSLRDRDLKKNNNDPDSTPKRFAVLAQRFSDMIFIIRNNRPIDPIEFLRLVNEAHEDKISIPSVIADAIIRLEKHGQLEKTRTGKIDRVFWSEPTAIPALVNGEPRTNGQGDLAALIAETTQKLRF
jgi:hypothetical protein